MSRESLRIIQITDTHISPAPERQALGVDSFQALANVLAVMQRDLWPPALIIATGDLADDGSPAAYGRLCSLLTPLACPVYCVPGNHDDWPTMCTTLQDGPVQCGRVVVREPWQLVLLNSQVPGHSHGFLPSSELTALEEAIQSAPDRHTLVGLHHGPLTVCPMEPCQLLNAEEFLALLQRYPSVRGVVSGHNHCLVEASQGHLRLFVTPSTCINGEHPRATDPLEGRAFWDVHRLTPGQGAFRRLALSPDGQIATDVVWVNHETPTRSAPTTGA